MAITAELCSRNRDSDVLFPYLVSAVRSWFEKWVICATNSSHVKTWRNLEDIWPVHEIELSLSHGMGSTPSTWSINVLCEPKSPKSRHMASKYTAHSWSIFISKLDRIHTEEWTVFLRPFADTQSRMKIHLRWRNSRELKWSNLRNCHRFPCNQPACPPLIGKQLRCVIIYLWS